MKSFAGPVISTVTLVISLMIAELCLRIFAPIPDPYEVSKTKSAYVTSQFPPNLRLVTEPEEGVPGVHGKNVFTTNNMGFRGDYLSIPKPDHEYRVFIVGGSAAECFILDDSQAINAVVQDNLSKNLPESTSVKVYNAGKSGDRSYDHVAMIVHRIVHLQPDMIILFAGVNDLTAAIYNADYLHYSKTGSEIRFSFSFLARMIATESQIGRRAYHLLASFSRKTDRQILEKITLKSDLKEKVQLRKSVPVSSVKPRADPVGYEQNLRTIAGVAKAHGIRLVFMTQPSTWNSHVDSRTREWHWLLYRNGRTYDEALMDVALDSLNRVMSEVASEQGVELFDLAKSIPKSIDFFVDDVHFNVKGAREAGNQLASFILERDFIARADGHNRRRSS